MNKIPFADLYSQYLSIKPEIDDAIAAVIRESAFIRGPYVERFETEFAEALGVPHCVSCANGTDALHIAMHALGIQPGDEVITTAHSWIATSETITQAGGRVVFCDTERDSFNIDAAQIEAKITPRTVGIIPVHLYGQAADMGAIMTIARKHGLWVIEDCAQAHLARYKGRLVGTFGQAATFSFYPGKNLGAMGDAGAIVTRDADLARRMAMFARHGGLGKGDHQIEGINSRLDGMQAAILSVKLRHLASWTRARQDKAKIYDTALAQVQDLSTPRWLDGLEHVYHVYAVRHDRRDDLARRLAEQGVQTVINYPVALPFLPAYQRLGHQPEDFPNAWHNQSRVLSLPLYPELPEEQQAQVVQAVIAGCEWLA
jgi:dTDP-4-amino-4,6-dideoxygalactose transaminase